MVEGYVLTCQLYLAMGCSVAGSLSPTPPEAWGGTSVARLLGVAEPTLPRQVSDNAAAVVPAQYICAPDSKHTFLAAPAQLLLEKFFQHHSHRFFPLSLKNHSHPVLSVDCYLNLGSQVTLRGGPAVSP